LGRFRFYRWFRFFGGHGCEDSIDMAEDSDFSVENKGNTD